MSPDDDDVPPLAPVDEFVVVDKTLIKPLRLEDAHGVWEFQPQHDMTAYELALINVVWTKLLQYRRRLDWREYLSRTVHFDERVDLARHFKVIE